MSCTAAASLSNLTTRLRPCHGRRWWHNRCDGNVPVRERTRCSFAAASRRVVLAGLVVVEVAVAACNTLGPCGFLTYIVHVGHHVAAVRGLVS